MIALSDALHLHLKTAFSQKVVVKVNGETKRRRSPTKRIAPPRELLFRRSALHIMKFTIKLFVPTGNSLGETTAEPGCRADPSDCTYIHSLRPLPSFWLRPSNTVPSHGPLPSGTDKMCVCYSSRMRFSKKAWRLPRLFNTVFHPNCAAAHIRPALPNRPAPTFGQKSIEFLPSNALF